MDNDPLLPVTNSRSKISQFFLSSPTFPLSSLLEEDEEEEEICLPSTSTIFSPSIPTPSSSSFKERIIFGNATVDELYGSSPSEHHLAPAVNLSSSPTGVDVNHGDPSTKAVMPDELPSRAAFSSSEDSNSRFFSDANFLFDDKGKSNLHRSVTAPAMSTIKDVMEAQAKDSTSLRRGNNTSTNVVRQAFVFLTLYLSFGVLIYTIGRNHFHSRETIAVIDALYFSVVTMCTIGYGDITPRTNTAKVFSIAFVLVGFGFIDILLSGMVSYILDLQESLLLSIVTVRHFRDEKHNAGTYLVDLKKGRMRIRTKVVIALVVVFLCVGLGTVFLHHVERLGWFDSFYLSIMSVTTVGYGDRAFNTMVGRLFASVWLLVSTLAVARAFLYLAEARIDKRHRRIAKFVLHKVMTVSEFISADTDQDGFVSKSDFVVYKLKQMGKVTDMDIAQVCVQFNRLDISNLGKITLNDLAEAASR